MGVITALRTGDCGRRVNVFVDGVFLLVADKKAVVQAGLQLGQNLSTSRIDQLRRLFLSHDCLNVAMHYLSYRPRSEAEVEMKLRRRGFSADVIGETMSTLKARGLIDDVAFAEFWKDNRLLFSPRSKGLLKLELRQKGVSAEVAADTVEGLDDEISAYQAGVKKARSLTSLGYADFRRRLSGYLRRRGFSYEVVDRVVKRLSQEHEVL